MRFLQEKHEIANALNLMKYPVITMDISKPADGWDKDVYEGSKVRVVTGEYDDGTPSYSKCSSMIFVDNYHKGIPDTVDNRLSADIWLQCGGTFLVDEYTALDVLEMAEYAMAPVLREGQEVAVVYKWYGKGTDGREHLYSAVRIMKVGRTSRHCSTVAKLVDVEEDG